MPYEFNIDHERRLVIRKTWGVFTETELASAREEYASIPEIKRYHELFDFLEVTAYEVRSRTITSLGLADSSLPRDFSDKKIALVALQNSVVWGLLRMYSSYENGATAEFRMFGNLIEAESWLAE
ncbi:MAG: hypothetical protein WD002_01305 [Pseudomonadales bacterium]